MFKSIKRLLIAATVIVAASLPSVAFGYVRSASGGALTSGRAQPSVLLSVPRATASSPQGFQWDDAGIGALGMLALASVGSAVAVVVRRRAHQPIAS